MWQELHPSRRAHQSGVREYSVQEHWFPMNFGIYLIGYIIVIAGVVYFMNLAHIHSQWIAAVAVIMLGAGILTAVKNTRTKDPN